MMGKIFGNFRAVPAVGVLCSRSNDRMKKKNEEEEEIKKKN